MKISVYYGLLTASSLTLPTRRLFRHTSGSYVPKPKHFAPVRGPVMVGKSLRSRVEFGETSGNSFGANGETPRFQTETACPLEKGWRKRGQGSEGLPGKVEAKIESGACQVLRTQISMRKNQDPKISQWWGQSPSSKLFSWGMLPTKKHDRTNKELKITVASSGFKLPSEKLCCSLAMYYSAF